MALTLTVEVVTPTKSHKVEGVTHVRAPGTDGLFGVLPRHRPAIMALATGEVAIDENEERSYFATSGGYCEIERDRVLFLVESSEAPGDIDEERARRALERVMERLKEKGPGFDYDRATRALDRAQNRLKVAGRRG